MNKAKKLYLKAVSSPNSFSYNNLCALAEVVGFEHRGTSGGHKIYKHPLFKKMMNFQPDKNNRSQAKPYQVKQLVAFIIENELVDKD